MERLDRNPGNQIAKGKAGIRPETEKDSITEAGINIKEKDRRAEDIRLLSIQSAMNVEL